MRDLILRCLSCCASESAGAAYVFPFVEDSPARLAAYRAKVASRKALIAKYKKQLKKAKTSALIKILRKKLKAASAELAKLLRNPPAR